MYLKLKNVYIFLIVIILFLCICFTEYFYMRNEMCRGNFRNKVLIVLLDFRGFIEMMIN